MYEFYFKTAVAGWYVSKMMKAKQNYTYDILIDNRCARLIVVRAD